MRGASQAQHAAPGPYHAARQEFDGLPVLVLSYLQAAVGLATQRNGRLGLLQPPEGNHDKHGTQRPGRPGQIGQRQP